MEKFRKRIKTQSRIYRVLIIAMVGFAIYDQWLKPSSGELGPQLSSLFGALSGLVLLAVVQLIRNQKLLRDETRLQMAYNKYKDERMQSIRAKAGVPIIIITSILMFLAGAFFIEKNQEVALALIIAATAQVLLSGAVKLYWLNNS